MPKALHSLAALLFISFTASSQSAQWAWAGGGNFPYNDGAHSCKVAPNGDVVVAGAFEGTIDLDPSAAVYNITSNGATDMFVARYTTNGNFLWGFNTGGSNRDAIYGLDFDSQGNIFISGYFRGTVDMDPSAGVANIFNNTTQGYTQQWGGDMFLAKYSPAGAYIWSLSAGGWTAYDSWMGLAVDDNDNAYVGGVFIDQVDVDPSAGTFNLNGATGKLMMVKYNSSGQFVWGKNFSTPGAAAINTDIRGMVAKGGNIYFSGFFMYTADFDPSASTASFTASGTYDAYVAKFDTAGNYVWAIPISGNDFEDALDLRVDANNNVYVAGNTNSTGLTFSPYISSYVAAPVAGNSSKIFMAKYTDAGVYQWGKIMAGTGTDMGWDVEIANNKLYLTGQFGSTVDFDPSAGVANLTSSGSLDIFVAQYDLNGNYICAFNIGGNTNLIETGYKLASNPSGDIFLSGLYAGTNVDFDPSAGTLLRSSLNNGYDAFLVKYVSSGSTSLSAVGDTICPGQQAYITFTDSLGIGTFSVTLDDGNNTTTYTNVQSGVPVAITPNPTATTTYTWSVLGQSLCNSGTSTGSVTIVVNPQPTADAGPDIIECTNAMVQLNGSGGAIYNWTPAWALNNSNVFNPTMTVNDTTITFMLVTTNGFGCSDTDWVNVSVHQGVANADAGPDVSVCPGFQVQLQGSGGISYLWYPGTGLNNVNIANPVFTGSTDAIINLVATDQYNCRDTDQVTITILPQPVADAGPDETVCAGEPVTLQGNGGNTYSWYPTTNMTGGNTATPTVTVNETTTFYLVVSSGIGCTDTDAVVINVIPPPPFGVSPAQDICINDSVRLSAWGGNSYSWFPGSDMTDANSDSVTVWPQSTTTYYVVITEPVCNYSDTESVVVNVHQPPVVTITKASPIGCGQSTGFLEASGAMSYVWSPSGTLYNDNQAATGSFATESTWYTVVGTDQYGCTGTDSAMIAVLHDELGNIFVPSAFTPNDDGKNDCFRILLPPGVTDYELHIYNRFGNNVHNADDASDCWDGSYNGNLCDVGVYFYYYKLKSATCGAKLEGKGDITLVR